MNRRAPAANERKANTHQRDYHMDKPKSENHKSNLGEVTNNVYSLLQNLESDDRQKIMNSVAQLFGDPTTLPPPRSSAGTTNVAGQGGKVSAQQYFAQKAPVNKGEMLAVAARYREEHQSAQSHTSADFAAVFGAARRNFDRHNFQRDINNAQRQAQLFILGTPKGQYQLSYYGQQFVDALPNREAVKKLRRRPGQKSAKKKTKPSPAK
jgi:hypothetical protein